MHSEEPQGWTPARLEAGDQLTIYTVATFSDACRAELDRAPALTIDLRAVVKCDSLGVQVLCAARRSAEARGKPLRFENIAPAVLQAAGSIGCESVVTQAQTLP